MLRTDQLRTDQRAQPALISPFEHPQLLGFLLSLDPKSRQKRATEVEQILDISRAHRPELNNFFSARGRGRGGARGGAPPSYGASASINAAVGKGNFPGSCFGCRKQGYRRFECPNCKDKPYTKRADAWAMVASGSTRAATSTPVMTSPSASISATSVKSEQSELADLMAQVKSMREELEHYRAMKEEGF
ncbi:hypothetical protein POSPLADRAFT_1061179 [Postia placenta MAD-698-R-SB12]|uniref:Uncharacterized protein n=1 Tax=Postia placenta MAD-698-R-SB12 TaxID=670580 RepID=A0A1X6MNU6_9APHY|nr:hypothetical protein POSPLADRAFT_1061179 [Postia placenta MAD-698-R-SB12]OSX58077.1 hypothetical protein POSPLADRAFT_1061179 [Postia placenta MAD-698-R-SB12]